jgi:hypothetical protein
MVWSNSVLSHSVIFDKVEKLIVYVFILKTNQQKITMMLEPIWDAMTFYKDILHEIGMERNMIQHHHIFSYVIGHKQSCFSWISLDFSIINWN